MHKTKTSSCITKNLHRPLQSINKTFYFQMMTDEFEKRFVKKSFSQFHINSTLFDFSHWSFCERKFPWQKTLEAEDTKGDWLAMKSTQGFLMRFIKWFVSAKFSCSSVKVFTFLKSTPSHNPPIKSAVQFLQSKPWNKIMPVIIPYKPRIDIDAINGVYRKAEKCADKIEVVSVINSN